MLAAIFAALAIPACTPVQLLPVGGALQGATGSMLGSFAIKNLSRRRCVIGGRPRAVLVGPDAKPFRTKARKLPRVIGPVRLITSLAPGEKAVIHIQWSNWCGAWPGGVERNRVLALRLTLTTGISLSGPLRTGRPVCLSKQLPSFLDVSRFGIDG